MIQMKHTQETKKYTYISQIAEENLNVIYYRPNFFIADSGSLLGMSHFNVF